MKGVMKAAAIDGFGPPSVLRLLKLPIPEPGPDEILIALTAAGVGVWDAEVRDGSWQPAGKPKFPLVLGTDGAGTVAAKGARVRRFNVGDRVWAYSYANPKGGFYAEFVAVKARDAGLTLLLDIGQTNVPGMHLAWATTERIIKSYPNSLYAFLKAIAEATVLSKQNPSVAKKAIGKYTNTDDARIIDDTYEQFAPYLDASLVVQVEPIQGHMMYLDEKEFPRLKDARPTDFIDNSFAEQLKNSGFLQTLGRAK